MQSMMYVSGSQLGVLLFSGGVRRDSGGTSLFVKL